VQNNHCLRDEYSPCQAAQQKAGLDSAGTEAGPRRHVLRAGEIWIGWRCCARSFSQ
jgi:hypothetical protein